MTPSSIISCRLTGIDPLWTEKHSTRVKEQTSRAAQATGCTRSSKWIHSTVFHHVIIGLLSTMKALPTIYHLLASSHTSRNHRFLSFWALKYGSTNARSISLPCKMVETPRRVGAADTQACASRWRNLRSRTTLGAQLSFPS
jgi:hypothetical protein